MLFFWRVSINSGGYKPCAKQPTVHARSIIISPPTIRAILAQRYPRVCGVIEQPGVASELLWLVPA
jgi:hypothetical protein